MVREALEALLREWSFGVTARSSAALERLATAHEIRAEVDREVAAIVDEASRAAIERRWSPAYVVRLARRRGPFDTATVAVIAAVVEGNRRATEVPPAGADRVAALRRLLTAAAFLADLPALPDLGDGPAGDGGVNPAQARVLEKVRALLAKAESTTFEEEAEALTAKAQELMARHAIDEALVAAARGECSAGVEACGIRIGIDEPYASPKAVLLSVVARQNRCRAVWSDQLGLATVFGSSGDLRAVEVLYTSLLVQAVAAMQRAGAQVGTGGRSRTRSFRHAFLLAFAERIGERLRDANATAEAAAVDDVGESFLPVLTSRVEAAERARDAAFPQTRRMRTTASNAHGYYAGRAAADAVSIDRGALLERRKLRW